MRRLLQLSLKTAIALAAIFFAQASVAQDMPQYLCVECRNIQQYPEDARNFSVNLMYGANSSLGFDETRFRLRDLFGNEITVDINAEYVLDAFDWEQFDVLVVEDILLQIILIFPNGDIHNYKYPTSLLDEDGSLPVPAAALPPSVRGLSGQGGGSGGGDSSDYWDEQDEYWRDMEEAWGGPTCWPDFSSPNVTTIVCNPWP